MADHNAPDLTRIDRALDTPPAPDGGRYADASFRHVAALRFAEAMLTGRGRARLDEELTELAVMHADALIAALGQR